MRSSEIIKRQRMLAGKYEAYTRAACMVKMKPAAGIPDSTWPYGRPLHRNIRDPYQFEITTTEVATNAAATAWTQFKPAPTPQAALTSRSITPRLSIQRLDKTIPGYSGFVPGLLSENICREPHSRCVSRAEQVRHA